MMKPRTFTVCAALSLAGLILSVLLFLFSFTSFLGGAQFFGSFADSTAPSPSPVLPSFKSYDIHIEYRGVFILNGQLAMCYLVEDSRIGVAAPLPAPRQGIRFVSGVPAVPFATSNHPDWSLPGIDSVRIRYGKPSPPDSWYARCVRVNIGLLIVATGILPTWWIITRVRIARARRLKGFEVSRPPPGAC